MTATIAIVGRPNVGKSTLFNRLIGRQHAIVDDQPGVTRDRREGDASLAELRFRVIDTAGLEEAATGSLEDRMRRQTERAIESADFTMMVIDARAGVTPADKFFADQIRRAGARGAACAAAARRSDHMRGRRVLRRTPHAAWRSCHAPVGRVPREH